MSSWAATISATTFTRILNHYLSQSKKLLPVKAWSSPNYCSCVKSTLVTFQSWTINFPRFKTSRCPTWMRPVQSQRWEFIRCCEFEITVNTGWCKNGITEDKPSKENPGLQPQVVFTSSHNNLTLHPITVKVLAKMTMVTMIMMMKITRKKGRKWNKWRQVKW